MRRIRVTRDLGRAAVAAGRKEPGWTPLLMEFWMHAARRDDLRAAVLERTERQIDALAERLDAIAALEGITPRRPVAEILRAVSALARGLGLEEAGAVPPPVTISLVDELEREPGAAAKLKLVISRT